MDGIIFKKDVANIMSDKRKLMKAEDALELINILISYIKEKTFSRDTDIYAISLGKFGYIHRKLYEVPTTMLKTPMYKKMIEDYCQDKRIKPLLGLKPQLTKEKLTKLEQLQNEYYENNQFKAL